MNKHEELYFEEKPKFPKRNIFYNCLVGKKNLKKVVSNIEWLFFDKVLRMGLGLVIGVWVARYLGPELYGTFNFAQAFVALFATIATLGLNEIVVRDIIRKPGSEGKILGTVFILRLIAGVLAFILPVIIILFLNINDSVTHWLVAIIAAQTIFQAFDTFDLWFQSQLQSKFLVYARSLAFIISSIAKVVLILKAAPLIAFAWVGLAEAVLGAIGLVVFYVNNGNALRTWQISWAYGRQVLKDGWPLILSGLTIMIYMKIDQVILGEMLGASEVGIYSAAVKLSEAWYFVPTAITTSIFPSIVEAKDISEKLFYERLQKLYNLMAILAYVIAIPTTFLANRIVGLLFGNNFLAAGPILALYIWAGLFANLGVARSSFLTVMNWTKIHLFTTSIGALINVILNIILIPKYGAFGSALATVISYWFAAHGACFFYPPLFKTGMMLSKAMILPIEWKREAK